MANFARSTRVRILLTAMALVLWASTTTPVLAATTSFNASFRERTTILVCPLFGAPVGAVCFRGEGNGTATPPGGLARHTFTGYLEADPSLQCLDRLTSHSTGTIFTSQGNLRFSATGSQCPPPIGEVGTWRATGGTGIFRGATGGGTYVTDDVVVNLDATISSTTSYTGTLNLP